MRWKPRSSRFDREVTAPNLTRISVTPSEIDGSSSSHVRYSPPTLGHSARLATDLSVRVSPRRAHSAGFAGQVVSSGAVSHVGQALLKRDSSACSSRLSLVRSTSAVTSAGADLCYDNSNNVEAPHARPDWSAAEAS
ncbi:hypothetical protein Taro_031775 [Colocasia esculenta]|uniref:Uncharacterized protein n=1 Tax=Colocasia esculenta TaxID=4460 RepID=A0A843VXI1_COLES|nr:hypothetical protein [Colocasia esculenta]